MAFREEAIVASNHHLVGHQVDPALHPPGHLDLVLDGEQVGLDDHLLKDHISHILQCKLIFPHLVSCRDDGKPVFFINFAREEVDVLDGFPNHGRALPDTSFFSNCQSANEAVLQNQMYF